MSRQSPQDPSTMALDDVVNGILTMSPPTLGGRERAELNLRKLKREKLNELFEGLHAELLRTDDQAKASWSRYQDSVVKRRAASGLGDEVRGISRLRAVRDAIRADRAKSGGVPKQASSSTLAEPARAPEAARGRRKASVKAGEIDDSWEPWPIKGLWDHASRTPYAKRHVSPVLSSWPILQGDSSPLMSVLVAAIASRLISPKTGSRSEWTSEITSLIENKSEVYSLKSNEINQFKSAFLNSNMIDTYLKTKLPLIVRDVCSMVALEDLLHLEGPFFFRNANYAHTFDMLKYNINPESFVFEREFLADGPPTLIETKAIESLAKISMRSRMYQPDMILSLSGGGSMLGMFLAKQFKYKSPISIVDESKITPFFSNKLLRNLKDASKILFIDDIIESPDKLQNAREEVSRIAPAASCRAVALVSSVEAASKLEESWFYSSNITPSHDFSLPWSNDGSYKQTETAHVFGYGSDRVFTVGTQLYERLSRSLRDMVAMPA